VEHARLAVDLLPGYAPALEINAAAEAQRGNPREAVELLLGPAQRGELRVTGVLELANAFLDVGDGVRAESTFRAVEPKLPPGDPRVAIGVASALATQSRWSEAAAAWENAVSRVPENTSARHNWAFSLWQAGRANEAEAIYRGILQREPASPAAMNDVAWFLAASGRDPGEAVTLAEQAYAARPDSNTADTVVEALLARSGCAAARAWLDSLEHSGTVIRSIQRKLAERCP
jgi:tetratricopeptide (TPR) repeat protein